MKIELFYVPGCDQCIAVKDDLRNAAEAMVDGVDWREVDVMESLDHAIAMGILTLPAMAIDGDLVFTALPTRAQLVAELHHRQGLQQDGT